MKKTILAMARQTPLIRLFRKVANRATRLHCRYPQVINIELTTKCNARCDYCARDRLISSGARHVRDMDMELFERIVTRIAELPSLPSRVVPVGLGDPMLYAGLPEALSFLRRTLPRQFVQMTSNAISFPVTHQQALIDQEIDRLVVSVNFHSRDVYQRHNRTDRFDQVVENTLGFLRLKGARKPSVTVQILDIKQNESDLLSFRSFWEGHLSPVDSIMVRPFNDFGGTVDVGSYINTGKRPLRYPCPQIFDHLLINVEGRCFPCCMGITATDDDPLCIGCIESTSIRDMYAPEARIHWVRRIHTSNAYDELPKCRSCHTWSYGDNMFFRLSGRWL